MGIFKSAYVLMVTITIVLKELSIFINDMYILCLYYVTICFTIIWLVSFWNKDKSVIKFSVVSELI